MTVNIPRDILNKVLGALRFDKTVRPVDPTIPFGEYSPAMWSNLRSRISAHCEKSVFPALQFIKKPLEIVAEYETDEVIFTVVSLNDRDRWARFRFRTDTPENRFSVTTSTRKQWDGALSDLEGASTQDLQSLPFQTGLMLLGMGPSESEVGGEWSLFYDCPATGLSFVVTPSVTPGGHPFYWFEMDTSPQYSIPVDFSDGVAIIDPQTGKLYDI